MVQQSRNADMRRHPSGAPRPPSRPQRRSRSSAWSILGYAALGVACLVLAAVSFLFIAAPVDIVRDRLVEEVRARTGRELVVAGPVGVTLLPTPRVTMRQVTLSGPAPQPGAMLVVASASADIDLLDLFSRRVRFKRLLLEAPQLDLVIDKSGRRNWDFASAAFGTGPTRLAQARVPGAVHDGPHPGFAGGDARRILAALSQVLPADVHIDGGQVRYLDQRSGERFEVTGIVSQIAADSLRSPVASKGTFSLRGQSLAYTARLTSIESFLRDGSAELAIKAEGAPFQASFEGRGRLRAGLPDVEGAVSFKSASVSGLGMWLGRAIATPEPQPVALNSRIELRDGRLKLVNFDGAWAGKPATGSLALDLNTSRPRLTGHVDLGSLDIGQLLLVDVDGQQSAAPQAQPQKTDPIGDLLRRAPAQPKPQVRGFTQRKGDWSDARLDTRLLALADAELRITAQEVVHRGLKTGRSRILVTLADRNLRLDLEDIVLYGGRGRGVAVVDAAPKTPTVTVNLTLDGVMAGPFLLDAAGVSWLEGRTQLAAVLAGEGFSQREMIETLSGTVDLRTRDGAVSGIDLAKVIRSLELGRIPALQVQPSEKTAFSDFGGQFVIAKGIARNNDLRLYTQHARLNGSGTVNLPSRQLNYDLRAKISGTGARPEQGAVLNFANIEIPIHVEGPWDKPNIGIKGQEQLLDGLKQVGKKLQNPEVQDAIKGLLGGDASKRVNPRDLLNKLLKKE